MIIIDPNMEGVTIWFRDNVSTIKGNLDRCCREIADRVFERTDDGLIQKYPLSVDVGGVGIYYFDALRSYGLDVSQIKAKPIEKILPRLITGYRIVEENITTKHPSDFFI